MKASVSPASDASRAVSTSTFPACGATLGRGCGRACGRPAGAGRLAGLGVGVGAVSGITSRRLLRGARVDGACASGSSTFWGRRRTSLMILPTVLSLNTRCAKSLASSRFGRFRGFGVASLPPSRR